MTATEVLAMLTTAGCRLIPAGDTLRVQDPQQALTDTLRHAIREHKAALLALLTQAQQEHVTPAPLGTVGRHGDPCPWCGDTWQWPTTSGQWVCSGCVTGRQGMPQIAPGAGMDTSHTAPDAVRTLTGADGRVWTVAMYRCPQCGGTRWGPKVDAPDTWWCLDCHPTATEAREEASHVLE